MYNRKVLLSDFTSYKAVVTCAFIRKTYPDVEMYTCDSRPVSKFLHSKYTKHHIVLRHKISDGPDYRSEILNIIRKHNIDIFIPVNSAEMDIFLSSKDEFGTALSYWSDYEVFKTLNDKEKLQKLCRQCGIKMPRLFESCDDAQFPVVLKPAAASAAKGVRYCRSKDELNRYLKAEVDSDSLIIQQHIKGTGVGYSVFSINGSIKAGYGHKRIAEYPVTGGSSMYRESFEDGRMADVARTLLAKTKWSGFAMFEFKLTDEGELYLLEVNPRIWGSINQGLQNGLNYFTELLGPKKLATGKKVNTYFSPFVYLSLVLYMLKGDFRPAAEFIRNFYSNKADISLINDPGGWLGSFVRLL